MNRLFATTVILTVLLIGFTPKETGQKPRKANLVFILTDEQRFDTSAPYGNEKIQTPNLNQLGQEAVTFSRAYVTQPVCSPARSSLLTGLYPHTSGVTYNNIDLPTQVKTLPEIVKTAYPEYISAYIGKWHLGREFAIGHGFDRRVSTEDEYTDAESGKFSDYYHFLKARGHDLGSRQKNVSKRSFVSNLPYENSKSKFMEARAIEFIEENRDKPFILYLGFLEPHSPINGPFNKTHDEVPIRLNAAQKVQPDESDPMSYRINAANTKVDSQSIVRDTRNYWGLVHQVDLSVGRIRQKLKELGLEENTILVYTSEHGNMLGEHHMMYKSVMYEGATRVPLFLKAPGVEARKISRAVSQIDLVPTLLDLMQVRVPENLPGKSLLPLMKGRNTPVRSVFMEWNATPEDQIIGKPPCLPELTTTECHDYFYRTLFRSVVQDGWKLNLNANGKDKSQLFNLTSDPHELHNLFYDKTYSGQVNKLYLKLKAWQAATNDTVKISLD